MNFYNEIDPGKAEWLRELIRRDVISPGQICEKSITEISASELVRYRQLHFFAGIGIWSYALRLAGWPDDAECWTGSCPCQPFSVAGKGEGTADERHLWPAWFRLIAERRPLVVFGEQVADGDGQTWLDAVQSDMESIHYRFGSVALPAAGFGAPHGRHRTFFVADAYRNGMLRTRAKQFKPDAGRATGDLADTEHCGRGRWSYDATGKQPNGTAPRRDESQCDPERDSAIGYLADTAEFGHDGCGSTGSTGSRREHPEGLCTDGVLLEHAKQPGLEIERRNGGTSHQTKITDSGEAVERAGPSTCNGFWSDAEWLPCTDGKARPVKPGTFPLAHGAPARVLRLRGYGDGIVAIVAAEFIKAYMQT